MTPEDIVALDEREFKNLADAYIKRTMPTSEISQEDVEALESPPALARLYYYLSGVSRSIAVQLNESEASTKAAEAGVTEDQKRALKAEYHKNKAAKLRFKIALLESLHRVEWLFFQEYGSTTVPHLLTEIEGLIGNFTVALKNYRDSVISDPEGWLEREEILLKNAEGLIGPIPWDDLYETN